MIALTVQEIKELISDISTEISDNALVKEGNETKYSVGSIGISATCKFKDEKITLFYNTGTSFDHKPSFNLDLSDYDYADSIKRYFIDDFEEKEHAILYRDDLLQAINELSRVDEIFFEYVDITYLWEKFNGIDANSLCDELILADAVL